MSTGDGFDFCQQEASALIRIYQTEPRDMTEQCYTNGVFKISFCTLITTPLS